MRLVPQTTDSPGCHARARWRDRVAPVLFDDQSNMKIKTAGPATIPPGGKVKSVHEAKAESKSILKTVRARQSAWPIRARPLPFEIRIMRRIPRIGVVIDEGDSGSTGAELRTGNEMPLPVRHVDASLLLVPVRLLTDASREERVGRWA